MRIVLRLGIDEREDDDLESEIAALPFVVNRDLADQYGGGFAVSLDAHQIPVVVALP